VSDRWTGLSSPNLLKLREGGGCSPAALPANIGCDSKGKQMPNIDWKWFLVGAAVGYFAVPYAMNLVKSR
jgi:hypothetical protein